MVGGPWGACTLYVLSVSFVLFVLCCLVFKREGDGCLGLDLVLGVSLTLCFVFCVRMGVTAFN